jgi:hypothetical protein
MESPEQNNQGPEELKLAELKDIFSRRRKEGGLDFYNKVGAFVAELLKEFTPSQLQATKLFHLVSDSGPSENPSAIKFTELDLPGGQIERFIREEEVLSK